MTSVIVTPVSITAQADQRAELVIQTGHTAWVESVAFSPDGKTLASGSVDKTIKLWSLETGRRIKSLEGHTDSVISVAFSPDGKTLASGSDDRTINLWHVETGQQMSSLDGHIEGISSAAFSPDGKTLASGSWNKTIKVWSVETGRLRIYARTDRLGRNFLYWDPSRTTCGIETKDGQIEMKIESDQVL
jgi:WD40 repeat protein